MLSLLSRLKVMLSTFIFLPVYLLLGCFYKTAILSVRHFEVDTLKTQVEIAFNVLSCNDLVANTDMPISRDMISTLNLFAVVFTVGLFL